MFWQWHGQLTATSPTSSLLMASKSPSSTQFNHDRSLQTYAGSSQTEKTRTSLSKGVERCSNCVVLLEPPRWPSASRRHVSWPLSATTNMSSQGDPANKQGRARPKNPRLGVGKSTLEEFTKNLEDKLQTYEEQNNASLLFSAEERRALSKNKPNFEILSSEKWPLFHTLAVSGDSVFVDRLLKQNIDVNALDKDGYSALQRAVLAKKETIVNQLLRAKADITVCDKAGATLLHYSVQTGSMNLVRSFLTCGVNVNSADKHGWTPLHLAVLTGRADIVRLLLMSGADKTLANKDGLTALDLCFSLGRAFNSIEIAKALKRFPKEYPTAGLEEM